jgi:hypothetical protein
LRNRYDGRYLDGAKEDAANVALERMAEADRVYEQQMEQLQQAQQAQGGAEQEVPNGH